MLPLSELTITDVGNVIKCDMPTLFLAMALPLRGSLMMSFIQFMLYQIMVLMSIDGMKLVFCLTVKFLLRGELLEQCGRLCLLVLCLPG